MNLYSKFGSEHHSWWDQGLGGKPTLIQVVKKKQTQRLSVTIDDNKAVMTVDAAWSSSVVNLALDREGNASSRAE